jgi:hypothetical protein
MTPLLLALALSLHAPMDTVQLIAQECGRRGVDVVLALSIVQVESRFNPRAWNGRDFGLFQLSSRYFDGYPRSVEKHVASALGLLLLCLRAAHGNVAMACAYYNGGLRYRTLPRAYIDRVLSYFYRLSSTRCFYELTAHPLYVVDEPRVMRSEEAI